MKRLIFTSLFLLLGISASFGQFTKIGGGLSYSTGFYFHGEEFSDHKSGNPIINLTGIYEISLPLHISPSFNIYIPRVTKDELYKQVISGFSIDIDGHYVFNYLDKFELYGLAGLNITFAKNHVEYFEMNEVYNTWENFMGLNLGIGTYYKLKEQFDLFGEAKYIVSKRGQLILTAGILLNIDWLSKNEDIGY